MEFSLNEKTFKHSLTKLTKQQQEIVLELVEERFLKWVKKQTGENLSTYGSIENISSNHWKKIYTTESEQYELYFNYLRPKKTFQLQYVKVSSPPSPDELDTRIKAIAMRTPSK